VNKDGFEKELSYWREWYNSYRPHMILKGRTPDEVYINRRAANTLPRIEPRKHAKHSTPCASPRMIIRGKAGDNIRLVLDFYEGNRVVAKKGKILSDGRWDLPFYMLKPKHDLPNKKLARK